MHLNSYTLTKLNRKYFRKIKKNHWVLLKPSQSQETKAHVTEIRALFAQSNINNLTKQMHTSHKNWKRKKLKVLKTIFPLLIFRKKKKNAFGRGLRPQARIFQMADPWGRRSTWLWTEEMKRSTPSIHQLSTPRLPPVWPTPTWVSKFSRRATHSCVVKIVILTRKPIKKNSIKQEWTVWKDVRKSDKIIAFQYLKFKMAKSWSLSPEHYNLESMHSNGGCKYSITIRMNFQATRTIYKHDRPLFQEIFVQIFLYRSSDLHKTFNNDSSLRKLSRNK